MINCEIQELTTAEERELRKWLVHPSADLFLTCLKAEQAILMAKALHSFDRQSAEVCRGGELPTTGESFIRQAAVLSAAIKILEAKITVKEPLHKATVTIA